MLLFVDKREGMLFRKGMVCFLSEISKRFFLTKLSYALIRHGGRMGIRAIDDNSGVIIYGA